MPLQNWSESIVLGELQDDPAFSDDLTSVIEQVEKNPTLDVALDLSNVNYLNSSNLAKLLRLRKIVTINNSRRLVLCCVNTPVWGLFLTTGLTKTFEFADNVALGLTGLQLARARDAGS